MLADLNCAKRLHSASQSRQISFHRDTLTFALSIHSRPAVSIVMRSKRKRVSARGAKRKEIRDQGPNMWSSGLSDNTGGDAVIDPSMTQDLERFFAEGEFRGRRAKEGVVI